MGRTRRRMVLGTGSGVGKSLVVAGLCRAAVRMGYRVMPFKSQNMSNNSSALPGGGEIARSQALQAQAARVTPDPSMNPILLKPMDGARSQVIFMGQPLGVHTISGYRDLKKELFPKVCEIFEDLASRCDLVILEGAGSPAEINLLPEDIANTRMARAAGASALLLGDIEQGGVFASLYGTLALLPPEERSVIRWLAINKFRGDRSLLLSGMEAITARTGLPFLGVMDHMGPIALPDEDSFRTKKGPDSLTPPMIRLGVLEWPHLSNRSDIDPFLSDPGVSVEFVPLSGPIPGPVDAIILPGTRETVKDLELFGKSPVLHWFREHRKAGKPVVGICGGYQMLGREIRDPDRIESERGFMPGLGLLPHSVLFRREKTSRPVQARILRPPFPGGQDLVGKTFGGYEIRHGSSELPEGTLPLFGLYDGENRYLGGEGLADPSGTVLGFPMHGLFDHPSFRGAFYGLLLGRPYDGADLHETFRKTEWELDRLADCVMGAFPLEEFFGASPSSDPCPVSPSLPRFDAV